MKSILMGGIKDIESTTATLVSLLARSPGQK